MSSKRGVCLWCSLAFLMAMPSGAHAEEAAPPGESTAEQGAAAAPADRTAPEEAAPPAEAATPEPDQGQPTQASRGSAPAVPDSVVRFGRVEMVLIENEDPESALEFGQELLTQDGDSPQLRLLMAACLMTLNRPADALEHLNRAARLSQDDDVLQLRSLFNIARALQSAGRLREAAEAYDRYVAFARSHPNLTAFANDAQRLARTLRTRAEASSSESR